MFAEHLAKALNAGFNGSTPNAPSGITPIVANAISTITGQEFFGPAQPMYPVAPAGTPLRQWDYQYAWNILYRPRTEQPGPSFEQLRMVAQTYDIVRLCIETRKDQVAKVPFDFRAIKKPGESSKEQRKRTEQNTDIPKLRELFKCPDGHHDFQGWIRMLLEDVLVIDGMSIGIVRENSEDVPETDPKYLFGKAKGNVLRHKQSGNVVQLMPVAGDFIKPLIDARGRRPIPPSPAYQQNLKGMPATNFTSDDIIYRPRNPRTISGYGYGPVEQILLAINIGLRREMTQLLEFTAGNIPEALISAPDAWGVEEIRSFQAYLDSLGGDLAQRRQMRVIPSAKGVTLTKEATLKNEFDEWLARIVCYAFSLPPTPFVRQMNRAVATQVQETALQEGLLPLLHWLAGVFNWIIHRSLNLPEVEFVWDDEQEPDQLKQAQIDKIYASYGKESVDEQRERDGEDPIGMKWAVFTPTGPIMLQPFIDQEATGAEATIKAGEPTPPPVVGNAPGSAVGVPKAIPGKAPQKALPPANGNKQVSPAGSQGKQQVAGDNHPNPKSPAVKKYLTGGGTTELRPFGKMLNY